MDRNAIITMVHGSGGSATSELIEEVFAKEFSNPILGQMEDSSVIDLKKSGKNPADDLNVTEENAKISEDKDVKKFSGKIAVSTDSFVVTPTIYPGGDIGRLAICGTVNDLLMRGSYPRYLTCGFIMEEGLEIETLKKVVKSMAATAKEAGVSLVAGDTKVVEGKGGLYINTAGIGLIYDDIDISANNISQGDAIIVSGNMGDHHCAILSERMEIETEIESDNAPLGEMVEALLNSDVEVHAMRDVTRGGLGTVLKEMALTSGKDMVVEQQSLPVSKQVMDFSGLLGLDPLYMGNEGKLVAFVAEKDKERALEIIKASKYGENAKVIGEVSRESGEGMVYEKTAIGGLREINILEGEGLPRIC